MSVKENRVHNLTKTLAVVSLLAPVTGHSLGIGDIKLHSALNQNLEAEIALVLSSGESASDITVNLAPPAKFIESGIPWTTFLSKIRFSTTVNARGAVVVKISSREAVKEPVLDFLLEVSWPKGNLYREFTVLLDPPAAYEPATLPVITQTESAELESSLIHQERPQLRRQPSDTPQAARTTHYGPIRKNDTLWKVAAQTSRQENVSVEQMMIALFEQNPNAFYKDNIHALQAGKTLKIPAREVVLKYSKKQAIAEYNKQTKAWNNRLAPAPEETSATVATKETPDNQLTLVAPNSTDVAQNTNVTPTNAQATDNKTSQPKPDGNLAQPANDDIKAKIADLEKQLALMQQLLALKDQQLATLQNQPQTTSQQPATTPKPAVVTPPPQPKVQPPVVQPAPVAAPVDDTNYVLYASAAAVAILLLAWFGWRKRQESQEDFLDSDLEEMPNLFASLNEKVGDKNTEALGSSAFFSEFTFGDLDTFDTDQGEIDPISEADVYLAYGRYQQAEELMRDVIKGQPKRDDYKLKLLEIFYSNDNKQAFENYAKQLIELGKKEDIDFWAKVTEMGSEICQDSYLFSSKNGIQSAKEPISFEKSPAPAETSAAVKNEPEPTENDTEFFGESEKSKLPSLMEDFSEFFEDTEEVAKNNETLEFDLNSSAFSAELKGFFSKPRDDIEVYDEFESFDFNIDTSDASEKVIDPSRDLHVVEPKETLVVDENFANETAEEDFDFSQASAEFDNDDFELQEGFDIFDLTDMDELETKLDLARAYLDLSDTEAAKDMATEVFAKGSVEQKKIAQALLNDLK